MAYESRHPRRASRDAVTAMRSLRSALEVYREMRPDVKTIGIGVNVGEGSGGSKGDPNGGTGGSTAIMNIVINAATQQAAEDCAEDFEGDGFTCTSTGETQVTCDYP
jgi:hypothetical protein